TAGEWPLPCRAPPLRTAVVTAGWNEPLPLPSSTLTLLWEPALTTARSGVPSWLKSATVTARGATPTGNVTGGRKVGTVRSSNASTRSRGGPGRRVGLRPDRETARDHFFHSRLIQDSAMRSLQKDNRG